MKIDDFTRLVPPQPAQVNIDPTPKDCPSDGFNYPTFRLLNKQERVKLSTKRFDAEPSTFYNHLVVANSKGWFAAVTVQDDGSYALICSPLADLRTSFKNAKDSDGTYTPKRKVALQSQKPSILAFATNDTRLFMSFEHGGLLVYDTAALFSEGFDAIAPLHMLPPDTGPIRHIVPNPGTEPTLVDLVAVVHSNRTVVLYNSKLETQGGWIAADMDVNYTPAAVAWSPKGKHLAIGLQGGHIMTYPLTNKSSIHKHVPPTALPPLISLEWLSPGHTFRTSYAPSYGTTDPIQHIICVDTKAPTATYYAPTYPFPLPERGHQSYTVVLPKWDEDAGAAEPKSLVVVGDKASVDLEILGSIGTQWYQQSQENPLSLPLDSNMEDTVLLGLQADLTDVETMTPVMYAYLNDGTVQGWYMEHTKPYPGMINPQSAAAPTPTEAPPAFVQPAAPAAVTAGPGTTPPAQQTAFGQSAFGQASGPSAFGQSSFGQPSAFGKPSAFGQQQTTSTFGTSAFGQPQTSPAFGQAASAGGTSAFGQPAAPSAFGGGAPTSAFGQAQPAAAFGQPATTSAFGGGGAPSAFGGGSTTGAFGSGAFGGDTSTNAFGGGAFGATPPSTSNAFGSNAFGGLATTGGNKNAFGQASFGFGAPAPSSPPPPAPAPDMSREASMSDATPSFGGMGLGEPNDPSKPAKSGGIFGAAQPTAPSTTTTSSFGGGPIRPATGFGAFATSTTTQQKPPSTQPSTSAFGTTSKPASAFGQSAFGTSGFGQSAFGQSTFGKPAAQPATTTTGAVGGGFGAFASSPVTSLSGAAAAQQPGNAGSAFRTALESPPKTSPPTGGFGAFASSPSAFGSAATTQEPPKPPTSATDGGFGAFGRAAPQAPTATSPFAPSAAQATSPFAPGGGAGPGFGVSPFGPQPGVRARSPFETPKPAALMGSPPSSPEATPRLGKTVITSDESPPALSPFRPSTTPVSSPFGALASGAFGNIQTSPSVFRPASGFGAFGGDKTPASSPFFKAPAEPKTPSVSAFANALTTPPSAKAPAAAAGSPMFGSSSSLGGARAAFTPAAPAPTPTKVPAVGGFGAFSGTSAGFGSFAGPKKSFGELLKTGDGDTTDPVKPKTGAVVEVRKDEEKQVVSAFPAISKYVPVSVFTPPQKEAEEKKKEPSTPPTREEKGKGVEKAEPLSEEPSFGNLSLLSDASSFAEVEKEESDEHGVRSGSEDADAADYDDDFLSEEGSEEEEEEEEGYVSESEESSQLSDVPEEEEEEEEEKVPVSASREPTVVPLPESRSPSATPQPEIPKIRVTPSPTPEPAPWAAREESTTPPGTPTKEPAVPLARPASAPIPAATPSTPFSLGLGRPSTRPTRSSPLANVPVSLASDDEASPVKPPRSPQPRYSPLPVPRELPVKGEDDEAAGGKPPRPQTPPLLSAFGLKKPDSVPSTPATPPTPILAPAIPPSTTPATPTFSLFGKSKPPTPGTPSDTSISETALATSASPSLFGKPAPASGGFGFFASQPGQSIFGAAKTTVAPATQPAPSFDLGGGGTSKPMLFSPLTAVPSGEAPSAKEAPSAPGKVLFGQTQVSTSSSSSSQFSLQAKPKEGGVSGTLFSSGATSTSTATATPFDLSGFSLKGKGPAAPPPAAPPSFDLSGFNLKGLGGPPAPAGALPAPSVVSPPKPQMPSIQVPTEAGMQRECMIVVKTVHDELANLGRLAEQHKQRLEEMHSRKGGRQREDLFHEKKWSPASAGVFGRVLVQFEKDLDELRDLRNLERQTVREIQGSMLKAGTRKEEISRFNKAKSDREFAKMLKARTLGPEHLETQTQLRRNIRTMRDRVQKLEDHLKESKKKLAQVKTGRPGLRAPSLDTINRTYRNIDLAIHQQSTQITHLKKRVAKLRIHTPSTSKSSSSSPMSRAIGARDARLPDPVQRPYNVTPHVAVTTAAALNAERSAHKLKRALLAVRKEPLLNTRAAAAPLAPLSFGTPHKALPPPPPPNEYFHIPPSTPLFGDVVAPRDDSDSPDWGVLPQDNFSPSPQMGGGRRGAGGGVKKHNVVPLKRGGASPSPTPGGGGGGGGGGGVPGFSWGPLPTFDFGREETFSMVEAVRLTPTGGGR